MTLCGAALWKEGIIIKPSSYILIAGSLWGIISLFVYGMQVGGLNSLEIVAVRAALSAVILLAYLFVKKRSLLKIRWKDIPLFLGTGILSIAFFNFCYFEAIGAYGSSAVPALLLYTAPVFVMIFSLIFFREKITLKKIIAVVMTLIGLALVNGAFFGWQQHQIPPYVIIMGLGSGLGYALYSIFGKFLVGKYHAITITTYTFVFAAIATVPVLFVRQPWSVMLDRYVIISAIGLVVLCTVLPYLLYTKGLQQMEAGKASILATIEPFVAAIVGIFIFKEKMTVPNGIGMVLIAAAILLLSWKKPEPAHKE